MRGNKSLFGTALCSEVSPRVWTCKTEGYMHCYLNLFTDCSHIIIVPARPIVPLAAIPAEVALCLKRGGIKDVFVFGY